MSSSVVLAFGELLWDLLPDGPALGGAPANFAYRIGTFGHQVRLVSRVGQDRLGHEALTALNAGQIDTSLVQQDPELPTGVVDVELAEDGQPSYKIRPSVAFDQIELREELLRLAQRCSVLYFGTLAQRTLCSRETLGALVAAAPFAIKLLDMNLRPGCFDTEVISQSLKWADIAKLNEEELIEVGHLMKLGGGSGASLARQLCVRFQVEICIVTCGERGAYLVSAKDEVIIADGYSVKVADTIGAGDSFTAAFMDAYLRGLSVPVCLDRGNRVGALVATRAGAMCSILQADIDGLTDNQRNRSR